MKATINAAKQVIHHNQLSGIDVEDLIFLGARYDPDLKVVVYEFRVAKVGEYYCKSYRHIDIIEN